MGDEEFLEAFERCTLGEFKHRDHLRVTWLYLRRHERPLATIKIMEGLRRFARHKGAEHIYDRAVTEAWIARVADALKLSATDDFEDFLRFSPDLTNKRL